MVENPIPIENQMLCAAAELPVLSPGLRSRVLAVAQREQVSMIRQRRLARVLWMTPVLCLCAWNLSALFCSAWSKVADWKIVSSVKPQFARAEPGSNRELDGRRFAESSRSQVTLSAAPPLDKVNLIAADVPSEKSGLVESAVESDESIVVSPGSAVASYSTSEWDLVDEIARVRVIHSLSFGASPLAVGADKSSEIFGSWTTTR